MSQPRQPSPGAHLHAHSHTARTREASTTSRASRIVLVVLLGLIFAATVGGMARLWPRADAVEQLRQQQSSLGVAPGVTMVDGIVVRVLPAEPGSDDPSLSSARLNVELISGPDKGAVVTVDAVGDAAVSQVRSGTHIQLMRLPDAAQAQGASQYTYMGVHRTLPIVVFAVALVAVVIAVARWKGVMSLVGLGVAVAVIAVFMLPALATSGQGILVGLVGAGAIMFVVIHVAHGFSMRTCAALVGTALGLALVAGLGEVAVQVGYLSGYVDEDTFALASTVKTLNLRDLWVAATILAGLGVLNDVTITQASAVWELRIAAPGLTRREVYASAMRIGRDHIASTIYTIVFAYTGAALATAILVDLFFRNTSGSIFIYETFAAEILRILASSIALVLSVPITTAVASLMIRGATESDGPTSVVADLSHR